MTKLHRFGAATFALLAGLAALGAWALIVATALVIGGLLALAGKLAVNGMTEKGTIVPNDDDHGYEKQAVT